MIQVHMCLCHFISYLMTDVVALHLSHFIIDFTPFWLFCFDQFIGTELVLYCSKFYELIMMVKA